MEIPAALDRVLDEAVANPEGGEIVVRTSMGTSGRVFVHGRHIAWVNSPRIQLRLYDVLLRHAHIRREDYEAAVVEAKATKANFGEVLIRWRLVDEVQLRTALLVHAGTHLRAILDSLDDSTQAMFLPQPRVYLGNLLFTKKEVLDAASFILSESIGVSRPQTPPVPDERLESVRKGLAACVAIGFVDASARVVVAAHDDGCCDFGALRQIMFDPRVQAARERLAAVGVDPDFAREFLFLDETGTAVLQRRGEDVLFAAFVGTTVGGALSQARHGFQRLAEMHLDDGATA